MSAFKNPAVIGVRQTRPDDTRNMPRALDDLGSNTGNMMFTEALVRVLENAKQFSFGFSQDPDIHNRDAIVLAAANWVNAYDDFGWLARAIEQTQLPVFIVGLGAQSSSKMEIPNVSQGTLRLLKIVEERSGCIAARGHFSCEVLKYYGINRVVAAGCPSLLAIGPRGPQIRAFTDDAPASISLHSTRHLFQRAGEFQNFLYRQAFKRGFNLILQSELADICVATSTYSDQAVKEMAVAAVQNSYGVEELPLIQAYLEERGRFFTTYDEWIGFMRTQSFCFGTRIHGTVAALKAGTPAMLIAHDSRTKEMAEIMNIPYVLPDKIDMQKDIEIRDYVNPESMAAFTSGFRSYYANYMKFFVESGFSISSQYQL